MLKKIRIYKGLTQKEVANSLGISQSKYSKLENLKKRKTLERLKKLSAALDLCPFSIGVYMISADLGDSIEMGNFLADRGACKECPYRLTTCPCDRREK